jgi:hypothetical protein
MVHLDAESKQALTAAAELRRIGVIVYVRTVTVAPGTPRSFLVALTACS